MGNFVLVVTLLAGSLALAAPPAASKELLEKGKASFEINCVACHGATGLGDGAAAAALNPRPRNFKTEPFKNGDQPEQVFKSVSDGLPGTVMIAFAHLGEQERWALSHYVVELRGPVAKPGAAAPAPAPKKKK